MKTLRKMVSKLWCILLCTLIVACSDSSDESSPEPEPAPTPTEQNYRLEDGVIEIKGDNLDYIVDAIDGSTLILSDEFPSDELPSVGDIVFVYPNAKKLNHGFLGRVTQIEKSDGNYSFVTEAVALDEAFSYLMVDETVDYESASVDEVESRLTFGEEDGYKVVTQGLDFTMQLPNYTQLSVEGKLTVGLRVRFIVEINDVEKLEYQRIEFSPLFVTDMSTHFVLTNSNANEELDKTELRKFRIPTGWVSFFASTDIVVSFVANLEAALNLSLGYQFRSSPTIVVESVDRQWFLNCEKGANTEEPVMMLLPDTQIAFEGSLFLGFAMGPEFKVLNRDEMKIAITPVVGGKCSAGISYNPETDKSLYEALEDDKLTISPLSVSIGAEATASIWKWQGKWSSDVLEFDIVHPIDKYIFPSFKEESLKYSQGNLVASTELGRDLLWKQDVGLALYNGDECIERSDSVEYKFENDFKEQNPLKATFEDISEENDYSVWSYVKWGDNYIKCKQLVPQKKIKRMKRVDEGGDSHIYYFSYKNDTISRIVKEYYGGIPVELVGKDTYNFNYGEDGTISVVGDFWDSDDSTLKLSLNEQGYIKSCKRIYSGGSSDTWKFEYNDDGQCIKVSKNSRTWNISYVNSNAVKVVENGESQYVTSFSYGTQENLSNLAMFKEVYCVNLNVLDAFGLVGMLGKPSKNLPTQYSGESKTFHWSLDSDGYPDRCSKGSGHIVTTFTWE